MFSRFNDAPPLAERPPQEKAPPAKPAATPPPAATVPCQCEPPPVSEPPPIVADAEATPQQVLNGATLRLLAILEEQGVDVGQETVTAEATLLAGKMLVSVTLKPHDGPSKIHWKLPNLHRDIVGVLNHEKPRKADWIAVKLRRPNDGQLRSSLSQMVSFGIIRKKRGFGYVMP